MSPPPGTRPRGTRPPARAPASRGRRGDDHVAPRHRLRIRQPRHQHGVAGHLDRRRAAARLVGRDHPHRLARQALQAARNSLCSRVLRGRRRHQHDRPAPGGGSTRSPGGSHCSGPTTRTQAPTRAGTRAAATSRPSSARATARCGRTAAAPARAARARPLTGRAPARAPHDSAGRPSATAARPSRASAAAARRSSTSGARRRTSGWTCGTSVATGTPSSSAASAGPGSGCPPPRCRARTRARTADLPCRPHRRRVGLQPLVRGGEDLVLGRRREAHARRLDRLAPLLQVSSATSWPRSTQRVAQRDHRERVARVAEGAEEDPQTTVASSATCRSCSHRSSNVHAIGATISVPTPASR